MPIWVDVYKRQLYARSSRAGSTPGIVRKLCPPPASALTVVAPEQCVGGGLKMCIRDRAVALLLGGYLAKEGREHPLATTQYETAGA